MMHENEKKSLGETEKAARMKEKGLVLAKRRAKWHREKEEKAKGQERLKI